VRVKIVFLKAPGTNQDGLIPLHHQLLLADFINEITGASSEEHKPICFSTLKGTSKVMDGNIRFLSTKVSLVITSPDTELVNTILRNLFRRESHKIDGLTLAPKSYQVIGNPKFETVTKYICISPYIPYYQKGSDLTEALHPSTHEFSDKAFEYQILRMERAGYSEELLHAFSEFEIIPDMDYFKKVENTSKKHPRLYKNKHGDMVYGYLFPFSVHAHPELQKFVWENGIGQFTDEGYGMLDTVPETPPITDHIVP
jgi:CRISPR-associated endoribonuclease Cas6